MTVTTPTEHTLMASGGDSLKRYLIRAPRAEYFRAVVTAVVTDAATGSIYALDIDTITGTGLPTNAKPGMTVDVGTTAGASDIGKVRLRFFNSTSSRITIAETAPAELAVDVGQHVTVRVEYLPWRIAKRIVLTRDGDDHITGVTEYLDYDIEYPSAADAYWPKPNIVAGSNADGSWKLVEPFGWEDTPGGGYRTVNLSALASQMFTPGATFDHALWDTGGDGVITVGDEFSDEITVQFPPGFRYVTLYVYDSAGVQDLFGMTYPIWCDERADPQYALTGFSITRDETEAGREMQFEFKGEADSASPDLLPLGGLVCYVEEPEWADGGTLPESYRAQCMGWISDETPVLKLEDSAWGFTLSGAQKWWASFRATSLTIIDPDGTPTLYSEMEHITVDRVLDFSLRAYSTLRNLVNVFYTGVTTEVETMTLSLGNTWQQQTQLVSAAKMSAAGCDSLGNLYLRRHLSYLDSGDRASRPTALTVTAADWKDADGLEVPTGFINPVGLVNANGEWWNDSDERVLYASLAPGKRDSYGLNTSKLPDQFLDAPTPQSQLNLLAGHHLAHENNPRPSVSLKLLGNLDVVEPAWNEPIAVTWMDDTVRGTALNAQLFLVKRVSIQHGATAQDEPKVITWTLEQVTSGDGGATNDTRQYEGVTPPEEAPFAMALLPAGISRMALIADNGLLHTVDFQAASPVYTLQSWSSLSVSGTVLLWVPDGFAPGYGWLFTTTRIYRLRLSDGLATLLHTWSQTLQSVSADASFSEQGFVVAVGYVDVVGSIAAYSIDGLTFTEVLITAQYADDGALFGIYNGCYVSSMTAGKVVTTVYTTTGSILSGTAVPTIKKSLNYGASWSTLSAPDIEPETLLLAQHLHFPWNDNASESLLYYNNARLGFDLLTRVSGATATGVSPIIGGETYAPRGARDGTSTSVSNRLRMLVVGERSASPEAYAVFKSNDGGGTWTVLETTGSDHRHGAISGDDPDTGWVWGTNNAIAQADLAANTLDDRSGNLALLSPGDLIAIAGF